MTATRDEIGLNDLAAVLAAAELLRRYDLISVRTIRAIRAAVHADCNVHAARYDGSLAVLAAIEPVWTATHPLGS
jgi:hypothetical protein